jgi:hypothetical protein
MVKVDSKKISFDIQDTEFLLRHLIDGQFSGREIEQASKTLGKMKSIHKKLMEMSIEV